jgi:hypothetical protein
MLLIGIGGRTSLKKESLMRAQWQQWVVPQKVLWSRCYAGLWHQGYFDLLSADDCQVDYSDSTSFSSVVARHRLMGAAMKISG